MNRPARSGGAQGFARRIAEAFHRGDLDLSARPETPMPGWEGLPEVAAASHLRTAGAGDVDIRLFLTFTAAMDRARDADRLWYASARLFLEVRWPYKPEEVCGRTSQELMAVLRAAGVSQRHGVDSAGWRTIAESLVSSQSPSPRSVRIALFDGTGDARELLGLLPRASADRKPWFPLLRGPKIGPMWVRMLAFPGGATIMSLHALPVAVDVQVRKVTEYLGVADTRGQDLARIRRTIQDAWAEDVRVHGAAGPAAITDTPAALDPALWFFGKWGCTRCEQARRRLPISNICEECRFDEVFGERLRRVR
jgi:hypothetical protein